MDRKMAYVTVGYIPTSDPPTPGTKVLIDPILSRNFEEMLTGGMPIVPEVFGKKLTVDSRCRSQIMSQAGVTDHQTAETLIRFYEAIEKKDWFALEDVLVDDLVYWVPDTIFYEHSRANRLDLFIEGVKKWTARYTETLFDVQWANISTDRGMVRMNMICDGKVIHPALVDYSFTIVDEKVRMTSISNFAQTETSALFD